MIATFKNIKKNNWYNEKLNSVLIKYCIQSRNSISYLSKACGNQNIWNQSHRSITNKIMIYFYPTVKLSHNNKTKEETITNNTKIELNNITPVFYVSQKEF